MSMADLEFQLNGNRVVIEEGSEEVSPAWDKTRGGRTRHYQERKENEAETKGA